MADNGVLSFTKRSTAPSPPSSGLVNVYLDENNVLKIQDSAGNITTYTPSSHIGSGGDSHAAVTTSVDGFMTATDKTILNDYIFTGWIPTAVQPVYVSSTSIRFNNINLEPSFPKGSKIKFDQATTKYYYVLTASYSGGHTTLTLIRDGNNTVANSAISQFYFSYGIAWGFPEWFTYTPTWTGTGSNPNIGSGTLNGRFNIIQRMVTVSLYIICASNTTYGSGNYYFGLPVAPSVSTRFLGQTIVEGATGTYMPQILNNNAYLQYFYTSSNGTLVQFTPTIPKTWNNGTVVFMDIRYPI